jgi:MFS-type transporter involved in bile tolerance (Atg22 family)
MVVFERPTPPDWLPTVFFFALGVFGSLGLAGIWTAGRKALVDLAPRHRLGEYFGLYGITTKLSVFGGWIFTALLDSFTPRIAMASQIALGVLALCFLWNISTKGGTRPAIPQTPPSG